MIFRRHNKLRELASSTERARGIFQQKNIRVPQIVMSRNENKGFIALFTAIIISVVLIIVSVSLNRGGYLTRGETLDAEYKNRSLALAEACAEKAMFKIVYDPTYTGNESAVAVGSDTCAIGAITYASFQYTINSSAVYPAPSVSSQGAETNLQVVVNASDFSLVSWVETP